MKELEMIANISIRPQFIFHNKLTSLRLLNLQGIDCPQLLAGDIPTLEELRLENCHVDICSWFRDKDSSSTGKFSQLRVFKFSRSTFWCSQFQSIHEQYSRLDMQFRDKDDESKTLVDFFVTTLRQRMSEIKATSVDINYEANLFDQQNETIAMGMDFTAAMLILFFISSECKHLRFQGHVGDLSTSFARPSLPCLESVKAKVRTANCLFLRDVLARCTRSRIVQRFCCCCSDGSTLPSPLFVSHAVHVCTRPTLHYMLDEVEWTILRRTNTIDKIAKLLRLLEWNDTVNFTTNHPKSVIGIDSLKFNLDDLQLLSPLFKGLSNAWRRFSSFHKHPFSQSLAITNSSSSSSVADCSLINKIVLCIKTKPTVNPFGPINHRFSNQTEFRQALHSLEHLCHLIKVDMMLKSFHVIMDRKVFGYTPGNAWDGFSPFAPYHSDICNKSFKNFKEIFQHFNFRIREDICGERIFVH
ncbi:hypothetical protein RFI_13749 [Reticulomyxa filosa]|uniref:Uncharacterized protein n=1 Tax=Reticulomyxa filosa TaxID=46433 RepID=X6NCF4_RETFI|nr:hypothetical protein RFI_13749 [Reticulomyxa filosa]|eukprot:ETO23434.1 hypothetical protein RFI_13749 [Reticulomyxa filosa]